MKIIVISALVFLGGFAAMADDVDAVFLKDVKTALNENGFSAENLKTQKTTSSRLSTVINRFADSLSEADLTDSAREISFFDRGEYYRCLAIRGANNSTGVRAISIRNCEISYDGQPGEFLIRPIQVD